MWRNMVARPYSERHLAKSFNLDFVRSNRDRPFAVDLVVAVDDRRPDVGTADTWIGTNRIVPSGTGLPL